MISEFSIYYSVCMCIDKFEISKVDKSIRHDKYHFLSGNDKNVIIKIMLMNGNFEKMEILLKRKKVITQILGE